jgi:CHASE3 domain sensor protein
LRKSGLAAAIEGFEHQKQQLDQKISEIRQLLNGGTRTEVTGSTETIAKPHKKRSAAVRRKMALAQRARYAKLKEGSEPTQAVAAKPKKKRKMSAAGRKAISEATKKRWAAVRAAAKKAAA